MINVQLRALAPSAHSITSLLSSVLFNMRKLAIEYLMWYLL